MKKLILVATGLIVVIAIALSLRSSPSYQPTQPQPASTQASRYLPYSLASFSQASDKKRVLYFHADWCPVCRPLDREFATNTDAIPEDVVLFKTNYDTETELKKNYAVTYQHTFVQVDDQGNKIAIWNGGGIQELKTNLK